MSQGSINNKLEDQNIIIASQQMLWKTGQTNWMYYTEYAYSGLENTLPSFQKVVVTVWDGTGGLLLGFCKHQ